ncbi:MAG TPA: oligosaccharide flippase family protein, partial [Bacillota bacterium]|nr:oligosaccharide flippase family protein [Bacillota bacterium]
ISLLAGGLAFFFTTFVFFFHLFPGFPVRYLWIAAALVPVMLFYMLGVNLLVGINRIKTFNFFEITNRLAGLIGLVIAALILGGVGEFLLAVFLAALLPVIALFGWLYRRYGEGLRFRRTLFTEGFQYAFKAYLVALLGFLTTQANILLLRQLSGSVEVGYYSIGYNIWNALAVLPTSVALVLFPRLVRTEEHRREITLANTAIVGGIMLAICLVTSFLARPLIEILFGGEFLPALPVLYWMLPGIFFSSMVNILSQYLAAIGFPGLLIGIWAAGFLMVLGLGYFLIPINQSVGAAISASATWVFLFMMHLGMVCKDQDKQMSVKLST